MSHYVDDIYEVGKHIRETLEEAPTRAMKIVDAIKRAISQMKSFWEQYNPLEEEAGEDLVNLPAEESNERTLFVATRITRPEVETVLYDAVEKKIRVFKAQSKWINYAARVGKQRVQAAIEKVPDNPVYTQMLNRQKYDPDYRRGEEDVADWEQFGEDFKVEGGQDQRPTQPVYQDFGDFIFKEEEGMGAEGRAKNPNAMSLEDIQDLSTQQFTYREEDELFR
ncbi:uncharacterized protein DFL_001388 [Arthrobotrys flagrans]|uniref:Uncharacterized protein n=1 Tax=Arthrobotrys flagrans TaxID=97331 RepID=A0A437AGY7_ARTFL|nr:hypothetical protein DFL_001388 [Arthrobotrys flagrans]